jgi:MtN3 and saliva related transmembrane protein
MLTESIGFLAAFCIAIHMFPQIFKSFKTKKVEDLSLEMLLIVFVGSVLWLIYGILIGSKPVIFSDSLGTLSSGTLLYIKIRYNGGTVK